MNDWPGVETAARRVYRRLKKAGGRVQWKESHSSRSRYIVEHTTGLRIRISDHYGGRGYLQVLPWTWPEALLRAIKQVKAAKITTNRGEGRSEPGRGALGRRWRDRNL